MTKPEEIVQPDIKQLLDSAPAEIKKHFTTHDYVAGDPILMFGEPNRLLYVILEGSAEVCYATPDGGFSRINHNRAYSVFGEVEIFYKDSTTMGVFALERCKIVALPKDALLDWMERDVRISIYLLGQLSEKMRKNSVRLRRLDGLSVNERVLDCVNFRRRTATLESYTKDELCAEASTPLRSVNRSLAYWRQRGVLEYKRRFIVLDETAMEQICAGFQLG